MGINMKQVLLRSFSLLFLVVFLTGCQNYEMIVHGLDERDANDILVFLDNKGIEAVKTRNIGGGVGGQEVVLWDIQVRSEDATEAMALLNAAGLPRRASQNLLNIFSQKGLVPSEMEEKIRFQAGLAAQIASTIRKIDGVLDADVQLSFPEEDPLNPAKEKEGVTASVYVKHTGVLDDPNTQLITKIRRLVSSSIQNLKFDNVTVIPDRARYADLSLRATTDGRADEHDWVRVWTLIVAKSSVTRFQFIFFSLIFLLLLSLIILAWLIWKVHLIIPKEGGVKEYFNVKPFGAPAEPEEEEEGEEEGEEKKKKKKEREKEKRAKREPEEEEEESEEEEGVT